MEKWKKIFLTVITVIIIVIICILIVYQNKKGKVQTIYNDNISEENTSNDITEGVVNQITEFDNKISDVNEIAEIQTTVKEKQEDKKEEVEEQQNADNKTVVSEQKQNTTQIQEKKKQTTTEQEEVNVSQNKEQSTKTETKQEQEIKSNENAKLANTTYRKVNTEVIPEIMSTLNNEIAKDSELKDYGSKAVKGNKTDAYNNTSGFTYLFVKDITKGKTAGNYVTFSDRVKNTVGAFGKYYVYAEDEYVYDSKGINSYWSQTLVWIYITF